MMFCSFSSNNRRSLIVSILPALSVDNAKGLLYLVWSPSEVQILKIFSLSVDSATFELYFFEKFIAEFIVYYISGFPLSNFMFLPGMPLDPPLAQIVINIFTKIQYVLYPLELYYNPHACLHPTNNLKLDKLLLFFLILIIY